MNEGERAGAVHEVVIVGGGPAGAAAALALARAGHRPLLIERQGSPAFKIGEALPPAARPLLRDLGVLDRFAGDGHLPCYGNLSAWGSPSLQGADFIYDPNGHGWHLDRPRFDRSLREAAREAGALLAAASVRRISPAPEPLRWRLLLQEAGAEREICCRWLIDAAGRRAAVARSRGACRRHDDRLVAFFMVFAAGDAVPEGDRDARTLIEAAPDGWWYTALVPGGRRVIACLTDADLAVPLSLRERRGFLRLLETTQHVRESLRAGGYLPCAGPTGAPAAGSCLDRFTGEGWLAAGDAALSFDPLSSQGILTALYTGMKAGQALHARLSGDRTALDEYAERLQTIREAYRRNHAHVYAAEARWAHCPFWKRRLTPGVPEFLFAS